MTQLSFGIVTAEQDDQTRKEAYVEGVKGLYKLTGLAIFSLISFSVFVVDETTGWGFVGMMALSWAVIIGVYALNAFDLFGDEWKSKIWARKTRR